MQAGRLKMTLAILVASFVVGTSYPVYCQQQSTRALNTGNQFGKQNTTIKVNPHQSAAAISGNRHTISTIPPGTKFCTNTSQQCPKGYSTRMVAGNKAFVPNAWLQQHGLPVDSPVSPVSKQGSNPAYVSPPAGNPPQGPTIYHPGDNRYTGVATYGGDYTKVNP